MQEYRYPSPGVRIEHILTEPRACCGQGSRYSWGWSARPHIEAWNDEQDDEGDRFLLKPLPATQDRRSSGSGAI